MQIPNPIRRHPKPCHKPSEEGYLLLAVMFLLFLLAISLTVAAPRMARSIQRDRDLETKERGKQYIRAVQLYYRKFHAYPPSVDALVKTNEIRFLRKKYTDPITGKDDWKPIMFGQNKVPIAMGFFGQPLAGSTLAGTGPSGGNQLNGASGSASGGLFNSPGGSSSSPFDSSNSSSGTASPTGSTDNSNSNSSSNSSTTSGTDSGGSTSGTSGIGGTTAGAGTGTGTGFGGQTGQSFGGAGIIGFEPASSKQSMLIWKKKDHYNEWEFTYDPIMDMKTVSGGGGGIGQPASGTSSPVGAGTTTTGPFGTTPGATSPGTGQTSTPDSTSSPQ